MKMRNLLASVVGLGLTAALAGLSVAPRAALANESSPAHAAADAGSVVVRLREGVGADAANSALSGLSSLDPCSLSDEDLSGYTTLKVAAGHTPEEALDELKALEVVESCQKNYRYTLVDEGEQELDSLVAMSVDGNERVNQLVAQLQVSDPLMGDQWALTQMSVFDAWDEVRCDRAVTVALLDLGCDVSHEDLRDNVVDTHNSYAAINGGDDKDVAPISVNFNHGTHVAGIVGAVANNSLGVAGVSYNANILPIKVVNDNGDAYTDCLVDAYEYILDNADAMNIRVVNISMGSKVDKIEDNAFTRMIDQAKSRGIVTVAAAGNRNDSAGWVPPFICYPGDYQNVVSVMSLIDGRDGVEHSFMSNLNAQGSRDKNISAPGGRIMSTIPNNGYDYNTGTSMATPQVSAILALEFAANPKLTVDQATEALYGGATDLGPEGFDETYGYGMANAYGAVTRAKKAQGSGVSSGRRLAGDDRYGTMSAIAKESFSAADWAVVTTGEDFPDALCASVLAGTSKGPVLITNAAYLNAETKAELNRLKVSHVYIVGGPNAVSLATENEIASMGIECIRVAGTDRQETSVEVMQRALSSGSTFDTVVIATGFAFPDSLSISPWCYSAHVPILLTKADGTLTEQAVSAIRAAGVRRAIIVGGQNAVSDAVIDQLGQLVTCERIAGADRYQTSVEVMNFEMRGGFGWQQPLLATGRNYPDALCGAPLASLHSSPLLLVENQSSPTVAVLSSNKASIGSYFILGGPSAVSESLSQQIAQAAGK